MACAITDGVLGLARCGLRWRAFAAAERAALDAWLSDNPDAQRAFLDHIRMRRQIRSWARGERSCRAGLERLAAEAANDRSGMLGDESRAAAADAPPGAVPPIPHSTFILHPSSSFFFGSGVLLSYLAVAVLLGRGLAAAWAWRPSAGQQGQAASIATIEVVENARRVAGPKTPVGRITRPSAVAGPTCCSPRKPRRRIG